MNTQAIRDYVEGTTSIRNLALAVLEIAAALDALDERTRGEGEPEPACDTCDSLGPDKDTAPSTIPGCHCRDCRYSKWAPEYKCWSCIHAGSPAYAVVSVPVDFGCTLGEREAE